MSPEAKIIKYIPLQQGLRPQLFTTSVCNPIIKYIPLQQGLRLPTPLEVFYFFIIIKYIPLQQGLRHYKIVYLFKM